MTAGNRTVQAATPGDSSRFLRGTQMTDAAGRATFTTIFPGWYRGRTVHIHALVDVGARVVHVGQLFFDDAATDRVYAANAPYSARPARDTRNANDGIYQGAASGGVLALAESTSGLAARAVMAVRRA